MVRSTIINGFSLESKTYDKSFIPDSIVRGTTSKEIVQMAKDVGARKVIFASCAPPIRYLDFLTQF
jgi:amidophosphoribosyltransferase